MAARELSDGRGSDATPGETLGEAMLRDAYARVVQACAYNGVPRADAEDLAQDLFLWLLMHPERSALLTGPALGGAIRIYLLRYRRRTHRRRLHEAPALSTDFDIRGSSGPRTDETTISVKKLEKLLPGTEACLLRHLKAGATWAEATTAVGVPPGSRDWLRKRMAGHIRVAFTGRRRPSI